MRAKLKNKRVMYEVRCVNQNQNKLKLKVYQMKVKVNQLDQKRVMYVKEMVFIQQMSLKNTKTMIQTKLKGVMYGLRTVRETAIHHMNHTN